MHKSFKDLSKCPDCGTPQQTPKKERDVCDNPECESYIKKYHWAEKEGLRWMNPNWD
jgi:hypothetical protein